MKRVVWKIIKWFFGILAGLMLTISLVLYFFKDDLIAYVVQEANKNLTTKISVSKIDLTFWATFPTISLDFKNVFIQDPTSKSPESDTLLYSDLIRLKFDPIDVWNENYKVKKLEIHPGTLHVKIDSLGNVNYQIIKSNPSKKSSHFQFELENVFIQNMQFAYQNQQAGQTYKTRFHSLNLTGKFSEKQFKLAAKSAFTIQQIQSENVTLVANKSASFDFSIYVNTSKSFVSIPKTTVYISEIPFQFNALFSPQKLHVDLAARQLQMEEVATKLSQRLNHFEAFKGKGNCNFNLKIRGDSSSVNAPAIVCDFDIQNASLIEPSQHLMLNAINLKGKYSNQSDKAHEYLKIWDLRFNTAQGPFQGEFILSNFANPHYQGKARGNIDLASLNSLFPLQKIDQIAGKVNVKSQFDIQTVQAVEGESDWEIRECNGTVELQDVNFNLEQDDREFKNISGLLAVQNEELGLQEVKIRLGNSDFKINGLFQHVFAFLRTKKQLLTAIDLQSKFIDISDLKSKIQHPEASQGTPQFLFPSNMVSNIAVHVGKFKFDQHTFHQIDAAMSVQERILNLNKLTVENAGAKVEGNLKITEPKAGFLYVVSDIKSENIIFKNLFKEWNNFDQQVIEEQNISGNAQVDMHLEAPFDLITGIVKPGIKAKIHLKITNGALKGVSTLQSITESLKNSPVKYLLKQRNILDFEKKLMDLRFQTLENTLIIAKSKIEIPWMEIKSNALDIETFGWHTFENQVDYHFAFRYRDLLAENRETEFGILEDDGTGVKLFMRMFGPIDQPQIVWDSKARKEQAKENREAAKQEAMSILKSEIGFRKNDTTIRDYQPTKRPTEELRIDFDNSKETPTFEAPKESELKKKIREKMNKLKESTKEEEIEFEVD